MLLRAAFAAAAYLSASLPGQSNAAYEHGNALAPLLTLQHPEKTALQEQVLAIPHKTTSPSIRPALGFALFVAVSTALVLLLRCIQSLTSSPNEATGASIRRLAGRGKDTDECKELEEAFASGGQAKGGQKKESPTGTAKPRTVLLPKGFSPKMLTADDVEDRIDEMENLVSLIGSAEKGDGKKGAGGRSLSSLVREAVKCYQKTVNGIVAPDVSTAQAEKFRALLQELEDILGRHIGKLRWVYTCRKRMR